MLTKERPSITSAMSMFRIAKWSRMKSEDRITEPPATNWTSASVDKENRRFTTAFKTEQVYEFNVVTN
jgi:hypothetical protein